MFEQDPHVPRDQSQYCEQYREVMVLHFRVSRFQLELIIQVIVQFRERFRIISFEKEHIEVLVILF